VRVRVQLFAACRDLMGASEMSLDLAPGARIADVIAGLVAREPRIERFVAGSRYARNDRFAGADEPLADGDEVAVIPPVSGGST
jgi:MoaD family protein